MALRVWLPLNGNLENQGLFQLPASPSASSISYTDGKIGRAASGYCIYHLSSEIVQDKWSLACWCYSSAWGQYNDILLCNNTKDSEDCRFYFSIIGGSSLNIGINGPSTTASFGFQFSTNTWYHVAATYDGTNYALYINGAKVKSGKCTTAIVSNKLNLGIGGRSMNENGTSATWMSTRLNDVRIYDHALSAKEVKELSKGLVLHYRLAGPGQKNLAKNTFGTEEKGYTVPSSGGSEGGPRYAVSGIEGGKTYTVSAYIKGSANINLYTLNSGGNVAYPWINKSSMSTDYKFYSLTFTMATGRGTTNEIYICTRYTTTPTPGDWFKVLPNSVKIEEGTIATPWCPNSSDSLYSALGYNNIEDDCSGYCHNGVKSGAITWDSDSPRYATSYKFNGSSCIKNNQFYFNSNIWTVSLWYKYNTAPTAYEGFICLSKNDGSDSNKKIAIMPNSNYIWFKAESASITMSSLKVGEWCHLAMVSNGTSATIYENGIQKGTITISSSITGAYDLVVGARASSAGAATTSVYNKGNISDVRIYATALSASDILELYEVGGAIDSNYNSYVYEYITDDSNKYLNSQGISGISDLEETDENTKWLSTGIIESNNFYEI